MDLSPGFRLKLCLGSAYKSFAIQTLHNPITHKVSISLMHYNIHCNRNFAPIEVEINPNRLNCLYPKMLLVAFHI